MALHSCRYKQICKGSKPHPLQKCKYKNNQGIHGHNFQNWFVKKIKIKIKKNKWLLVCQNLYELSLVSNSDCLLLI